MPLTLSNWEQNSGYFFYIRRLAAAVTRFSVRMQYDDRKQRAAVVLSISITVILCLLMVLLRFFKPAGLPGEASLIGNRDTGAVYVLVDGRLHPAFNLVSARLVVGSPASPKWVSAGEIAKYPSGARVGIADAPPSDMRVNESAVSAWAACDTAASRRAGGNAAAVTAIAGSLTRGRADVLGANRGVLVSHAGVTFVVWGNLRSQVDLSDRAVTVSLGLDPGSVVPVPMSTAVFDALPSSEPIVVPTVPDAGAVSPWASLGGARVGSVINVRDADGGKDRFYAVLMSGLQPVAPFTANLLRTANSYGEPSVRLVSPDKVLNIPQVDVLNVGFYPKSALTFVDTAANPVTCVSWEKNRTDRQAAVQVWSGRALPVPPNLQPVQLVRDDRDPASVEATEAVVIAGAANFVATTSGVVTSETRESLWWVSAEGVRFGVGPDVNTLRALALDRKDAVQAPWPILRMFAAGPELSRERALTLHDTVGGGGQVAVMHKPGGG